MYRPIGLCGEAPENSSALRVERKIWLLDTVTVLSPTVTPGQLVAVIMALPPAQPESARIRIIKLKSRTGSWNFLGNLFIVLLLWNRIIPAAAEWIASQHTPYRKETAAQQSVSCDSLKAVMRTGRVEPAGVDRNDPGKCHLVGANQQKEGKSPDSSPV